MKKEVLVCELAVPALCGALILALCLSRGSPCGSRPSGMTGPPPSLFKFNNRIL